MTVVTSAKISKDIQTYKQNVKIMQKSCANEMHTELVPVVSIHQNQQAGGKEHDLTLASSPLS